MCSTVNENYYSTEEVLNLVLRRIRALDELVENESSRLIDIPTVLRENSAIHLYYDFNGDECLIS